MVIQECEKRIFLALMDIICDLVCVLVLYRCTLYSCVSMIVIVIVSVYINTICFVACYACKMSFKFNVRFAVLLNYIRCQWIQWFVAIIIILILSPRRPNRIYINLWFKFKWTNSTIILNAMKICIPISIYRAVNLFFSWFRQIFDKFMHRTLNVNVNRHAICTYKIWSTFSNNHWTIQVLWLVVMCPNENLMNSIEL